MIRLFLPPERLASHEITIDGEQARYLASVLRVQTGESITLLDGLGHRYVCRVLKVHRKEVMVEKLREEHYPTESPLSITLAQGLPKGDKMDLIVQKATELGVSRIIPLVTERSQVRHTDRIDRWRRIALSASQQSGRERVPHIDDTMDFGEFLDMPGRTQGIILSEQEKEQGLKEILSNLKGQREMTILVGPEGGFSKDELIAATRRDILPATLGPRILRTETAPIVALGIIQYELGDMG